MSELSHNEARQTLPELALDALDGAERDAVLAHVQGCIECRRELQELQSVASAMAESVPLAPMPPEQASAMRARLLDRALSENRDIAPRRESRPPTPWLMAAGLLLAASVGGLAWLGAERSSALASAREAQSRLAATDSLLREAESRLAQRDTMIAALTGPSVKVVSLASTNVQDPSARMFWDQATNKWTLVGHNLPQPGAGRTYQLWLITAGERISAGTFRPGQNGEALVQATYALDRDALVAIAVTEEPEGGVPQPTGPIIISGRGEDR